MRCEVKQKIHKTEGIKREIRHTPSHIDPSIGVHPCLFHRTNMALQPFFIGFKFRRSKIQIFIIERTVVAPLSLHQSSRILRLAALYCTSMAQRTPWRLPNVCSPHGRADSTQGSARGDPPPALGGRPGRRKPRSLAPTPRRPRSDWIRNTATIRGLCRHLSPCTCTRTRNKRVNPGSRQGTTDPSGLEMVAQATDDRESVRRKWIDSKGETGSFQSHARQRRVAQRKIMSIERGAFTAS